MIRRAWGVAAAAAAFVVSFASAMPAWAARPGVDVEATECRELDVAEVERVLGIELSSVASQWHGEEKLRTVLSCEASRLSILVIDPVTGKRLSRTVPMDWRSLSRDRTVALLVSQLFLTSWSELLLARDAATPLPLPAPPPAVEHAAAAIARSSLAPPSVRWGIALLAGARVRELPSPLLSVAGNLRPSLLLGRSFLLFFDVGYERGSAARTAGSVEFSLASATLGGGWRRSFGLLGLQANLRAGAAFVDMHGNASGSALGASASGAVMEAALELGPTVSLGRARVGLLATVGATVPPAVAHVVGDRDVNLAGAWLGAGLSASFPEGGP
jgi:hypothetical protein